MAKRNTRQAPAPQPRRASAPQPSAKEVRAAIGSIPNVGRTLSINEAQRVAEQTGASVAQIRSVAQNQGYNIGARLQDQLSPVTRGDTRRSDVQLQAAIQSGQPVTRQTINQIARNTGRSAEQVRNTYMGLAIGSGGQRGAAGGVGSLAEAEALASATGMSVPEVSQLMIDRGMSLGYRLVNQLGSGAYVGNAPYMGAMFRAGMNPLGLLGTDIEQQLRGVDFDPGRRFTGAYTRNGMTELGTTRGGGRGMGGGMGAATQPTQPSTISTGRRGEGFTSGNLEDMTGGTTGLTSEDLNASLSSALSGINMPDYSARLQAIQDQFNADLNRPQLQMASLGRSYTGESARAARRQRRQRTDYLRSNSLASGLLQGVTSASLGALGIGGVRI